MKVQLIGLQEVDFKNSEGQTISGKNLFVAFSDENVYGLRTEKFFIKDSIDIPKDVKPNDKLNLSMNYKGKVEEISKVIS